MQANICLGRVCFECTLLPSCIVPTCSCCSFKNVCWVSLLRPTSAACSVYRRPALRSAGSAAPAWWFGPCAPTATERRAGVQRLCICPLLGSLGWARENTELLSGVDRSATQLTSKRFGVPSILPSQPFGPAAASPVLMPQGGQQTHALHTADVCLAGCRPSLCTVPHVIATPQVAQQIHALYTADVCLPLLTLHPPPRHCNAAGGPADPRPAAHLCSRRPGGEDQL